MLDRLYIDTNDRERYSKLKKEVSFLKEKTTKELFLFTMAYGFENKLKKQISKKEGFVRMEYLKEEDWALIYSIAIYDAGMDILEDEGEINILIEQYAHGGVIALVNEMESMPPNTYEQNFELFIHKIKEEPTDL